MAQKYVDQLMPTNKDVKNFRADAGLNDQEFHNKQLIIKYKQNSKSPEKTKKRN